MPHTQGQNIRLLPTYGVDNYGTDVFLPIFEQNDNINTINVQNTTWTHSTSSTGNFPIDHQDEIISDESTLQFYHAGTDTEFDHTWTWVPDMSALVYKTRIQLALCLNVPVVSAGTFDLTSVDLRIRERPDDKVIFASTIAVDMTGLTAVGSSVFVLDIDFVEAFKVFSGNPIEFLLTTTVATGTGDFEVGIVPFFPYNSNAGVQPFTRSGFTLHIHASLDHADPIFNQDIKRIV